MSQIDNVVNIESLDELDRQKLDPRIKLQLLCIEAKTHFAVDPRGNPDRFMIVGRPRAILQLLKDFKSRIIVGEIRMHQTTVIGDEGGDVVGFWEHLRIVCRSTVKDDNIYIVASEMVPPSMMIDRRQAAMLRLAEKNGTLENLS